MRGGEEVPTVCYPQWGGGSGPLAERPAGPERLRPLALRAAITETAKKGEWGKRNGGEYLL